MISYIFFENLKRYQRALITISTLLLLVTLWLVFVFFTLRQKINNYKINISSVLKKQELLNSCASKCDELSTSIRKIKKNIKDQIQSENKNGTTETNMSTVIACARSAGLTLRSCKTVSEEALKELFRKQKISYEFYGTLDQAMHFCRKFKEYDKLIECDEIAVSITENNTCNISVSLTFLQPTIV